MEVNDLYSLRQKGEKPIREVKIILLVLLGKNN